MKRKIWLFGIVVLVFIVAAASIAAHNALGDVTPEKPEEAVQDKESSDEESYDEQVKQGVKTEEQEDETTEYEIHQAEGILTGRIDSHSVEIEVGGQLKAFGLNDELQEKEFASGDITFQYYVDNNGRSIITEADFKQPRQSEVHIDEGENILIFYQENEQGRQEIIKVEKIF